VRKDFHTRAVLPGDDQVEGIGRGRINALPAEATLIVVVGHLLRPPHSHFPRSIAVFKYGGEAPKPTASAN
jgi:hypothetical protein